MKKIGLKLENLSSFEYERLNNMTKVIDEKVDTNSLIHICEFLKNKKILVPNKINYPRDKFIYNMITRVNTAPNYIPSVQEFLESTYFSDLMKKSIYDLTSTIANCERVNFLLKSDMHMNSFPVSQLSEIKSIMTDYILYNPEISNISISSFITLSNIYDDYMFLLDGLGPVNYIKSHYSHTGLAKEILAHSGLAQKRLQNCNKINRILFNEDNLISIYNKLNKYIPWACEDFVLLVSCMKNLSPASFVNSFYDFVDNKFSCDNIDLINDNISFDDTLEYDQGEQGIIKSKFLEVIDKPQKVLKLTSNKD